MGEGTGHRLPLEHVSVANWALEGSRLAKRLGSRMGPGAPRGVHVSFAVQDAGPRANNGV
jgi:hypothetical protein